MRSSLPVRIARGIVGFFLALFGLATLGSFVPGIPGSVKDAPVWPSAE